MEKIISFRFQPRLQVANVPLWIIAVSFGPYIFPAYGLRTDHLLIYGLFLLAIPMIVLKIFSFRWYPPLLGIVLLLSSVTLWTLVVTWLVGHPDASKYLIISSFENYIQPVTVILLVLTFFKPNSLSEVSLLFQKACQLLIVLLFLNSILTVIQIFFDISGFIQYFTMSGGGDELSVSSRAATMGRYCGVFNQPVESGLGYSLGLLGWGYLARIRPKITTSSYIALVVLILGGCLSVSKSFILGGLPLFFLYLNPISNIRRWFNLRLFFFNIISLFLIFYLSYAWKGLDFFLRLFVFDSSQTNLIELFTAGRFGSDESFVKSTFLNVWDESPVWGFGFGASALLDNGYLEFFLQGGVVALLGYAGILFFILWVGIRSFMRSHEEGRLLLSLLVLILGAGLGAPVLTINRASTVLWVFITLIFLMSFYRNRYFINCQHSLVVNSLEVE